MKLLQASKIQIGASILMFAISSKVWADTTPIDANLTEDGMTMIECNVRDPKENKGIFSQASKGAENPLKSTKVDGYHYNLYIPKGYYTNADYRYPCLFISSPGGNAGMGSFDQHLKRDEWIVVMLQESRNGSPDWLRNFLAAHDDVIERVRIAKGAKFATGMSGGARCSSVYATMRPGFAGIICQAAGFAYQFEPDFDPYQKFPAKILVAATFGDNDGNLPESQNIRRNLKQCRTQVQFFKGGHEWCPYDVFDATLDWMESILFVETANEINTEGKTGKLEDPGEDAFRWYYRKCERLLAASTAKPARGLILERLRAVIKKGSLGKDKLIAEADGTWKSELDTLHASPEFKEFDATVRQAFIEAQKDENEYTDVMKWGTAKDLKMEYSVTAYAILQKTIKAYRAMLEKYPDSPLSFTAKHSLTSLEVESSKMQIDDDWRTHRDPRTQELAEGLRKTAELAVTSGNTKTAIESYLNLYIFYPLTDAATGSDTALEKLVNTADETTLAKLAFADKHPRTGFILMCQARECGNLAFGKRLMFRELAWRTQPQDFEAMSLLAFTLCEGDTTAVLRAARLAEQALELCDAYYPAWEAKAMAAFKLGHEKEARQYARSALDFVPEDKRNALKKSLGSILR